MKSSLGAEYDSTFPLKSFITVFPFRPGVSKAFRTLRPTNLRCGWSSCCATCAASPKSLGTKMVYFAIA